MQSWDAAFKKLKKRSPDVWKELSVATPFEFDPSEPDSFFASYLQENPPEDAEIVLDRVDRDQLWAAEIVFSAQKFLHVFRLTKERAQSGNITWASTDAHHALILGARCFLATLGVGICQGKSRVHLIDFRPESGAPQDQAKFKKKYKHLESPLGILTPNPKNMEQKQIFELFNRLVRLITERGARETILSSLEELKLGAHKSERNKLLYHGNHWHWLDDLNWPSIDLNVKQETLKGADGLTKDFYALSLMADLIFTSITPLGSHLMINSSYFETLPDIKREGADPLLFVA